MSVFTGISSMTGVSTITNVATGIVTSGLVLHLDAGNAASYSGSGTTWTDLSGNSNTGTLTNGPTYSSANSGSIVFDGTNDYALVTNPSTLRNQDFTVSVWINPETQNQAIVTLIDFDHALANQGWVLQSEDATTNRYFYFAWADGSRFQPSGGGGFGAGKGIQLTTGVWQNITYTKSGTSLLGYKNGTQTYTGTATNANVNYISSKNMRIADCISLSSRTYKGNISQVAMYNRAISASEVTQNYNALRERYGL